MTIYIILFGVLLWAGLFFIAADLLRLSTLATQKAMLSAGKQTKTKAKTTDVLLRKAGVRLSRYIPMDEYKKSRMANILSAAGFSDSPELFTAMAVVKAAAIALCIIPCLIVLPLLAPIVLFAAVLVYFKEIRKADEALAVKRGKIEQELPRFVATITQELKASRDVLSMLENFKKNAGEDFAAELDILTADMRSSSYEAALTRFESKFNSPMLSDITRGLISVLRGDEVGMYFQMLTHDMKQLELQRLKAQAMKIPPKIRVFSFAMLMCFLMTYMAIIVYEIITSLSGMF
ncbi:secretion protein F [Aminipila sp.]|uniref:secretion protein F n=1 Tax=Aminipila sp. TaxID=2060095 RepID=UPI0028971247|nr:secretion protein F [Aminipila sp.]